MAVDRVRLRLGAWYLIVGVAEVVICFGSGLIGHNDLQDAMFVLVCVTVDAAMAIGIIVNKPAARRAWITLWSAQMAFTLGVTVVLGSQHLFGDYRLEPLATVAYTANYLLLAAGLWIFIRRREAKWSGVVAIDVAIVGTSAILLAWLYLVAPLTELPNATVQERLGLLSYPVFDLMILTLSLRLIFDAGRRPISYYLLLSANLAQLVGDTGYLVQRIHGTYSGNSWVAALYVVGALLLTGSAVHPSMTTMDQAAGNTTFRSPIWRLTVLYLAALAAPAVLAVQYFRGDLHLALVIAIACATLFSLVVARMFGFAREQQLLAATDALTGVYARRRIDTEVARLIRQTRGRDARPVIAVADIDHFKHVNDTYGHDVGDEVLRAVAQRLADALRRKDFVGRYGGEEFVVLLHDIDHSAASTAAERLRRAVADTPVVAADGTCITVTASFGVAMLSDLDNTAEAWVRRADQALYRAKRDGRNRVVIADELRKAPEVTAAAT